MNYADTNWLEAVYILPNNAESRRRRDIVERFMRKHGNRLAISHIVLLEARNIFRRTTGDKNPSELTLMEADFGTRVYVDPMNWDLVREESNGIFERYSWKYKLGSFDTAIIASAKLGGASRFLSFDSGAKVLAVAEGLDVFPSLEPHEREALARLRT